MNVNQYVLKALKAEKVNYIFCVPGAWLDPLLYDLIEEGSFKVIVAAHEEGAAFMADGYARSSQRFGVCAVIGGPGLTNTVTGVATAKTDLSALLIISGETDMDHQGRGNFQDSSFSSVNMLSSLMNMQLQVTSPRQIIKKLETLFQKMLNYSARGPVHLSLPVNIQHEELVKAQPHNALAENIYHPRYLDIKAADKALDALTGSKNIAILAGAGVRNSQAWPQLWAFAEKFAIPVATTLGARGAIPDQHPLSLGMLGRAGHRPANEALASHQVDSLIVLGSRLNEFDTLHWAAGFKPLKHLILNDLAADSAFCDFHVDFPVIGDVKTLLDYWLTLPDSKVQSLLNTKTAREEWLKKIRAKGSFYLHEEDTKSDVIPIHPARAIHDLRQAMPENTVFYVDTGAHAFFVAHYCGVNNPQQFASTFKYMGAMGWAIPAGIGAKFARPDLPHVVITGDGCMLMHGIEIQTAAAHNLPIIFLVMNNRAYGNPLLRAEKLGKKHADIALLQPHDWVKFAESLGVTGLLIEDPKELVPTFKKALALNKTVLINVVCGNFPTPTEFFDYQLAHFY